ncbi:hypothetical protein [Micromonospora coerulea]|uniref:hypothetical protein n=1 Tax=Micromonospora coerulea TaxID=47856 RepID=UPI001903EA3A|nr:hypothetical protein [Micromonospora veneta]
MVPDEKPRPASAQSSLGANLLMVWLLLPALIATSLTAAGCDIGQRETLSKLVRCSSSVSIEGYRQVDSYAERASWNVAYVGPAASDPLMLLPGDVVDLAPMDAVPAGPFVIVGRGEVVGAKGSCTFFLERWNTPASPTVIDVDRATSVKILNGTESLLLLSFIASGDEQ